MRLFGLDFGDSANQSLKKPPDDVFIDVVASRSGCRYSENTGTRQ